MGRPSCQTRAAGLTAPPSNSAVAVAAGRQRVVERPTHSAARSLPLPQPAAPMTGSLQVGGGGTGGRMTTGPSSCRTYWSFAGGARQHNILLQGRVGDTWTAVAPRRSVAGGRARPAPQPQQTAAAAVCASPDHLLPLDPLETQGPT